MAHGHTHKAIERPAQEHTLHIHQPSLYARTLVGLLVAMFLTVWASYWHFGDIHMGPVTLHGTMINNFIAMGIATFKAALVMMFFMGLKYATKLTKMWAAAGFVMFSLMFLTFGDYATRQYETTERWTATGTALSRSVHESRQMSAELGRKAQEDEATHSRDVPPAPADSGVIPGRPQ